MSIDDRPPGIHIFPLIGNEDTNPLTTPNARAYIERRMNSYATPSPLFNRVTMQEEPTSIPPRTWEKIKSCMRKNSGILTTPIGLLNIEDNGKHDFIIIFKSDGIVNHDEYRYCIVREGHNNVKKSIPFKDGKECLEMSLQRWKSLKSHAHNKPTAQPTTQHASSPTVKPVDTQRSKEILKEPDGTTTSAPDSHPTPVDLRQSMEDGAEYAPEAVREFKQMLEESANNANEQSRVFSILERSSGEDSGYKDYRYHKAWRSWEKTKKIDAAISQAKEKGQLFVNVTRKNQSTLMTIEEATQYKNQLYKKMIDASDRILRDRAGSDRPLRSKTDNNHGQKTATKKPSSSKEPNQQMETEQAPKTKPFTFPNLTEQDIKGLLKEDTAKAFLLMQEHHRVGRLIDEASKNGIHVHLTVNGKPTQMTIDEARAYQESLSAQGARSLFKSYPQDKDAEKALENFKKEMFTPKNKSQDNKPAQSNGPAPSDPPRKDEPSTPKASSPEDQSQKAPSDSNDKSKASPLATFLSKPAEGETKQLQDRLKYALNKADKATKLGQQIEEARNKNRMFIFIDKNGITTRIPIDEAEDKHRLLLSKAVRAINYKAPQPSSPKPTTRIGRVTEAMKNTKALTKSELRKNGVNNLASAFVTALVNHEKYETTEDLVKDVGLNAAKSTATQVASEVATEGAKSLLKEFAPKIADNIPGASTLMTVGHYGYALSQAKDMDERLDLVFRGAIDTGWCFAVDVFTTPLSAFPGAKGLASGAANAAFRKYVLDDVFK